MQQRQLKITTLLFVVTVSAVALFFVPAIPQDPVYHLFVDDRTFLGIANFCNVVSNLAFILVGLFGLSRMALLKDSPLYTAYVIFCLSIVSIGLGSAYYHSTPTTASLVWDRLPMALAFMALLAAVVADGVSVRVGRALLAPLLVSGMAAVGYWFWSEIQGAGDLRWYGFVQALPVVLIPLIIVLFGLHSLRVKFLWSSFFCYLLAKLAEHWDQEIYFAMQLISGHSLKHLLAAIAVLCAILSFPVSRRQSQALRGAP